MSRETYNYSIVFEPFIRNLEYTLNILNPTSKGSSNSNVQGSIILPASNLFPIKNSKKDENLKHKSPEEYILELSLMYKELPICLITKNLCQEVLIENGEMRYLKDLDLDEFKKRWMFNSKNYGYATRNQILEIGQIISVKNYGLSEREFTFALTQIHNNYSPFTQESMNRPSNRYYSNFQEVEGIGSLSKLSDLIEDTEGYSRLMKDLFR